MDIRPSKDKIIFELHNPCGLFNQVSCVENAVALSYFLKKDLVIHKIFLDPWSKDIEKGMGIFSVNKWYNKRHFVDNSKTPKITDLLDTKPYGNIDFIDQKLDVQARNFSNFFFNFADSAENEEYFSVGRNKFNPESVVHYSFNGTLGWYSTFFMNRTKEVDRGLSMTKFKPEYYHLAESISKFIGPFVGAHVRLTDNQFEYHTQEQIEIGMSSLKEGFTKVVVTDHPKNERIMSLKNKGVLVLEEIIEQEFYKDFQQLKFTDEVSLGLLANLVMCKAEDFIGSQGSTFTGHIQRHVGGNMRLFGEQPYERTGPYTWNGYKYPSFLPETIELNKNINRMEKLYDTDNRWWREWPESKLFPELI